MSSQYPCGGLAVTTRDFCLRSLASHNLSICHAQESSDMETSWCCLNAVANILERQAADLRRSFVNASLLLKHCRQLFETECKVLSPRLEECLVASGMVFWSGESAVECLPLNRKFCFRKIYTLGQLIMPTILPSSCKALKQVTCRKKLCIVTAFLVGLNTACFLFPFDLCRSTPNLYMTTPMHAL